MNARYALVLGVSALLSGGFNSAFATTPDANLFTTYTLGHTSVEFDVCSTTASQGCFGGGTMGPFQHACAIVESAPHLVSNIVTRNIYILDKRASRTAPIKLYVYQRQDAISDSGDSVQVKLRRKVLLDITGGGAAKCLMAANDRHIYVATSADTKAAEIRKDHLTVKMLRGFNLPQHVKNISADNNGFVSVEFEGGYFLFVPTGGITEDGGGSAELADIHNSLKF